MKKRFILDTNVLLYDCTSIYNFQEHDIIIPITTLEELDKFKKGNQIINQSAREVSRQLDKLATNPDTTNADGSFKLGKGKGNLTVKVDGFLPGLDEALFTNNNDNKILALAKNVAATDKKAKRQTVLVTKDINMRLKARSLGVIAEDYETGKVQDISELYTGTRTIEVPTEVINKLYEKVEVDLKPFISEPVPNEFFNLTSGQQSVLVTYQKGTDSFRIVNKQTAMGISPRNREQIYALDALLNPDISLVTLNGKAGTGKTLLALAAAIEGRSTFLNVMLSRPIVPLGNDIGFLPGNIDEKIAPYMQPLWDNVEVIKQASGKKQLIEDRIKDKKIQIAALPYMRGRSLPRIFMIIDEAQNLTPHEVKTLITRAGEGTKIVFTGDIEQIDTPYMDSQSNGLSFLIDKFKGQDVYAHVKLLKGERSYLAELASNIL